jgi:hypothetical protein
MDGPPPSREAFGAEYRSLSTAKRRAFIADLQEARGWETNHEAAVVVATQGEVVRRIAVDQPDTDVPIDVVVADDERLRSLADDRNADVLSPETLRDELFYALDRQEGWELFRNHFGDVDPEPTEATEVTEAFSPRSGGTNTPPSIYRDRPRGIDRPRTVPGGEHASVDDRAAESDEDTVEIRDVIPVVLLFVAGAAFVLFLVFSSGYGTAAIPGFLSGEKAVETTEPEPVDPGVSTEASGDSTATRADATAGTDGEGATGGTDGNSQGLPPGLSINGNHDFERLAATHAAAVKDHGSLRFRVRSDGPVNSEIGGSPDDLDVQIAANNQFLIEERNAQNTADGNVSVDVFADGAYEYRRFDTPNGVRYNRYSIPMNPTVTDWISEYGADLIRTYLNTSENAVVRTYLYTAENADNRRTVDNRTAYRITVESPPPALANEAANYRAIATVLSDGTVRTLTVSYEHEPTGEDVWIRFRYDIGETELDTPLWYERARAGFDSTGPRPGV